MVVRSIDALAHPPIRPEGGGRTDDLTARRVEETRAVSPTSTLSKTSLRSEEAKPDTKKGVEEASPASVAKAAEVLNQAVQQLTTQLQFTVDDSTHQMVVKVVDMETNEVVRQIPQEEALELAKALHELRGLIIRKEA